MKPYWQDKFSRVKIYVGDCREVLPHLDIEQFHAVVTDPPYEIGFINKKWDNTKVAYDINTWKQVLRVTKSGGCLLAFGATRTYHRMVCAVEDAEFNIRDMIGWIHRIGFPKSHNISKAIDELYGVEPTPIGVGSNTTPPGHNLNRSVIGGQGFGFKDQWIETIPTSEDAKLWSGWGTTLNPALEPIVLAQKSMTLSIANNTLEHGCGGLNIDECKIPPNDKENISRWPSNIIHDGSDELKLVFPDGSMRFFYSSKATSSDRPHGKTNIHPTVKPLALMEYLVKLVCAKGGRVLDPFMGSGSTGCAAISQGMEFTGIELNTQYADMAIGRIKLALESNPNFSKLEPSITRKRKQNHIPLKPKRITGIED